MDGCRHCHAKRHQKHPVADDTKEVKRDAMARSAANSTSLESPFQDVPSTPRVWRIAAESPAGIVPDLSLLQQQSDTTVTPGRYQNVPMTPRTSRTPQIHIRHPYHLIARMRVSTTPNVTKSPQSDQVVPVLDRHTNRTEEPLTNRRYHKSPPQQQQPVAVSNPNADFWDVFSGDNIFG
ncbi:hypothetical protein LSAT2_027210 [Lamellibrachia satsuma]|nr:hypothetical protein LSAT2_027210 [Lamellibrachia satsuma]